MILCIVGAAEDKFDWQTRRMAYDEIYSAIHHYVPELIISGECLLGGIDAYTRNVADSVGIPFRGYPPANLRWSTGYKPRNIQMAQAASVVLSIAVRDFPQDFKGDRFPYCYHCRPSKEETHVKSGGCWAAKHARFLGKVGYTIIVGVNSNDHDSPSVTTCFGHLPG